MTDTPSSPSLVWFRQDLRVSDNPALMAAAARGAPITPLYIYDQDTPGQWARGGASKWWLDGSLKALQADLEKLGLTLQILEGKAHDILKPVCNDHGFGAVYWNRCYEPYARERDKNINSELKDKDIEVQSFNGSLLIEPWHMQTKSGGPFRVFSPYWKNLQKEHDVERPLETPQNLVMGPKLNDTRSPADLNLLPTKPDWAGGMRAEWSPGTKAAWGRLGQFIKTAMDGYKEDRNLPAKAGTSKLSPHLHFGEISPRQIWWAVQDHFADQELSKDAHHFLSEVVWREFSYNLLYHYPDFPEQNYQCKFNDFPWKSDDDALKAWQKGQTGYPIVDAGMRELWHTGWMHNRVRMIVASFLIKHLMIDWREGEAWFWDTLVDADLANNSASWQWVAGSGADAAPYFRIFNPITQGEKFDPKGDYIRQWVPELKDLPTKDLFAPWEAGELTLAQAGITLGKTYPHPLVDHKEARDRALSAFESLKDKAA